MAEIDINTLGPVDFIVVEFPDGTDRLTGEGLEELRKLVDTGQIRVLDLLFLAKDDQGVVEASELTDLADVDDLRFLETELAALLAEDDVERLAEAMLPNTLAAVLVYENLWAAPFASAIRRAGGQLVANDRIPIQAIIASLEAEAASTPSEGE
jgi:hypothetical protein